MKRQIIFLTAALILGLLMSILAGCSDSSSSPTSVTAPVDEEPTRDTAPPATPTGMCAVASAQVVKLGWQQNTTDPDLVGYMVYRSADGRSWALTQEPIAEPRFIDQTPWQRSCYYCVSAVDEAGNESAWCRIFYDTEPEMPAIERSEDSPQLR